MSFAAPQIRKLKAKLRPQHVKSREADGISLNYLEGWHVLAEANRIFGFDGWDRESVTSTCVWTKQLGSRFAAAYVTRVRIRAVTIFGAFTVQEFFDLHKPAVWHIYVRKWHCWAPSMWMECERGGAMDDHGDMVSSKQMQL
jgi:hypothetical protein